MFAPEEVLSEKDILRKKINENAGALKEVKVQRVFYS
jgi:hypothetical protein